MPFGLISFILTICATRLILADLLLHVVVISQNVSYEVVSANELRRSLETASAASESIVNQKIKLTLLHEFLPPTSGTGFWAIWPMLLLLLNFSSRWTLFCSPFTKITDLPQLLSFLPNERHSIPAFIGRALHDEMPVIIHHFDDLGSQYPDLNAGFLFSGELIQQLSSALQAKEGNAIKSIDFTIDPMFEFAKLVLENTGVRMTDNPLFCLLQSEILNPGITCLTEFHPPDHSQQCEPVEGQSVFYAVKTHEANHWNRIPVIKRTWAKRVPLIGYFSDTEDSDVPTINLGVPNTQRGHCEKTLAIIHYGQCFLASLHFIANDRLDRLPWLVIADDDTLLSIPRLHALIGCFSNEQQQQQQRVIIGQRYGYGFLLNGVGGYDYPTGGSGMIFSREAVRSLVTHCSCPKLDSPDDMIIGICARQLAIPIVHSDALHQAPPNNYARLHLRSMQGHHLSFHKFEFENLNPKDVYTEFLMDHNGINGDDDNETHNEL